MKTVIYKSEGIYYITAEENYAAGIRNSKLITKMQDFNSAEEIISYLNRHLGTKTEDFIIVDKSTEEGIKK